MKFLLGLVLGFVLAGTLFFAQSTIAEATSGVTPQLEKTLDDVNNQWLCSGKYYKPKAQDCVNFRAQYWADQFFEIYPSGLVQTKAEMVVSQTKSATEHPDAAPGTGPNPQEFKLMAVYGNIALATDHTIFKAIDASGKLSVTGEARVLRIFVKENGKWRPASAALIGLEKPK
ncbi:MAG TPA: nuclear transport factor 2 family protein [Bryobacteraceae bacterium]|nr:nuclear transport factor 2 family protein [Bryobacteraceae bacterium]